MTIQQAYRELLAQLYDVYDSREAANISDWVIEHVTGQAKIDRIVYKDLGVPTQQQERLQQITKELLQHQPVQYVLGEVWFAGMKLFVNDQVLIPRPETEELVEWVIDDLKRQGALNNTSLLDVGTGSGCISIAIKKKLPALDADAIDISEGALDVARKNATDQNVAVKLFIVNFLDSAERSVLPKYHIIVSNPPYIKQSESVMMQENVLANEPHIALFVPDNNALVFYEALAEFGEEHLEDGGSVYMEINEALGEAVSLLFEGKGYSNIELRKDLQGKDRMVKAKR